MRKTLMVVIAFSAVIVTAGLLSADDRKEPASRAHGSLPPLWSRLGLTDEQKQQAYSIQTEYRAKIDDLERQVRKLRKDERAEMEKVLTDAQKARLRELISERAPGASKDEPKDRQSPDKK
jgi:hypothetical protein